MGLIRFASVLLLVLATTLSGVTATAHGEPASASKDMIAVGLMADDQSHCCQEIADRAASCHVLPALVPATLADRDAPDATWVEAFARSTMLVGTEPSGPLDPPRTV